MRLSPKAAAARHARLMPAGVPRYVRCYDDGGSGDRYTVVFTGRAPVLHLTGCPNEYPYLGMSGQPFHPQGVSQHGFSQGHPVDAPRGWPPAIGRRCHLGTRIKFADLPADCRAVVLAEYRNIWRI